MRSVLQSRRRWAVPLVVLASVVGLGTIPGLLASATAGTPNLPALSPADLVTKAVQARLVPLSGTVTLNANLGLPSLGSLGPASGGAIDLLSGVHDARVWIGGPDRLRVALPAPLAETNWIRNGNDLWAWDSSTQRAVHATVPAEPAGGGDHTGSGADPSGQTPVGVAQRLLSAITPTTTVTVDTSRYVAGRPAYELSIAPKDPASTIGSAALSIDAATGLPLDVRVTPRGSSQAAFDLGFSHLTLAPPAASNFTFTPPPGATVVQAADPAALLSPASAGRRFGRRFGGRKHLPAPGNATSPESGASAGSGTGAPAGPSVTTVGTGWEKVAVFSAQALPPPVRGLLDGAGRVTVNGVGGRLLTSPLVNVLALDDGRVAVGAVIPEVLQHALAGH
jgi:outer membrane lipoprotein-sorting protein